LVAGLIVNAFEYGGHRVYLDKAWTAAFRALGKRPAGWSTFIPANFLVGILMVWLYARLRPRYGGGPKAALGAGLAIWAVFWLIPLMAIAPMDLFPNSLLAGAIGLGLVDANLAVLVASALARSYHTLLGKSDQAPPRQIVFLVWVTFGERKWSILAERRSVGAWIYQVRFQARPLS
jgi:hypothetical protein